VAGNEWMNRKGRGRWIRDTTRFAIYARDGFDCVYCHGEFPLRHDGAGLTLDHVIPRSKGGSNAPENVVTACWSCNSTMQDAPRTAAQLRAAARATAKPIDYAAGRFYHARRKDPVYAVYEAQTSLCV
jgi:5-methylcytosine-specific restriction endonuclease McrA